MTQHDHWWPSPFGSNDQIGMLNLITSQKIVQAARLVKDGRLFDLSHVLDEHVPAFPGRTFHQSLVTSAHLLNQKRPNGNPNGWGENQINWITEIVHATFQIGTHLDALNHLQIGQRFYNGRALSDIAEEWGTNQLGIETVPQIVTRGLLLDIAALHQVKQLEKGTIISVSNVESCLAQSGLHIQPGDAILFHTGWGNWWGINNEVYLTGEPGPGLELACWLVEKGVALSGCDTWSYGPVPAEDPNQPFVVPQTLNVKHGMFIVENLKTADLAANHITEFLFVLSHANVRGATAAWVAPIAIV